MANKKRNRLASWMITRPALFAVISFITMTAASAVVGMLGSQTASILGVGLIIIAFLGAAAWLIRTLPHENLDRRSFVAINNAQTVVTSISFIVSTLFIISNARAIMIHLLYLESHSSAMFLTLIISLALGYLYLCGIFIGNLYAKYRRVRAMGVSMWKILATAPFGFSMLWIPGYLMNETSAKSPALEMSRGWYSRLTDRITSSPMTATIVLATLIIISGFTFGFAAILLTFGMGIIFAAWSAITGPDTLRKNIGGTYATVAIILNIVMWVSVLTYSALAPGNRHAPENIIPITQTQPTTAE